MLSTRCEVVGLVLDDKGIVFWYREVEVIMSCGSVIGPSKTAVEGWKRNCHQSLLRLSGPQAIF